MPESTPPRLSSLPSDVNAQAPGAGGDSHTPSAPVPVQVLEFDGKPWWQSKTIIGAIVVIAAQLLSRAGIPLSPDDSALTETVAAIASIIGGVLAIYGRSVANRPVSVRGTGSNIDQQAGLLIWAAAFLGALLMGCTSSAGRVQGSITAGYHGNTVRVGSDGKTTTVDLQMLNPEGLAK